MPAADAVVTSLRFAAVATVIAVALGTLAAAGVARSHGRLARLVDAGLLIPLGTSAVTVGFGFLITLDAPPLDLRNEPILVPLAQAVVALPFVVRTVLPVLRSVDRRLHEAAAVLGASPSRVWREVDLPIVARAGLVAAGFAFAISLGEFGATTVIAAGRHADCARRHRPAARQARIVERGSGVRPLDDLDGDDRVRRAPGRPCARRPRLTPVTGREPRVRVEGATVRFGPTLALDGIDLEVHAGEVVSVLGPSGSGKSTLLRAVAGLQGLDRGRVLLDGQDQDGVPTHRRDVGLMFQDHALFPHRDVAGNVGFGLRMRGDSRGRDVGPGRRAARTRRAGRRRGSVGDDALGRRAAARRAGSSACSFTAACCCSTSPSARSTGLSGSGSSASSVSCSTSSGRPWWR